MCSVPKFYFEFKIQNYGFVLVLVVGFVLVLVVVPELLPLMLPELVLVVVPELAFDGEAAGDGVEAGVIVAAGDAAGLLAFVLELALPLVFVGVSQAIPKVPKTKTAERAIVFFIFNILLSSQ